METKRKLLKRYLVEFKSEICMKYEYSDGDFEIFPLQNIVKNEDPFVCPHQTTQVLPPFKNKSISEETTKKYNK